MGERKVGIILSYVNTALHVIVNIAYVPILLSFLGTDEYGFYELTASLFSYVLIFESGISVGVTKMYCKALVLNDEIEKENVLATARRIYRILSIIVFIAGIIIAIGFRVFYRNSFTLFQLNESVWMFFILSINYIVTLMNLPYNAAINAHEKFFFLKSVSIIFQLVQPLICIMLLIKHPFALTMIVGQFIVNLILASVRFFYARYRLNVKVVLHYKDKNTEKEIIQFAASVLLANIADQIFWKADQIILGKMMNAVTIAIYAVSSHIYMNYLGFGAAFSSVFFPRLTKLYTEKKHKEISDLFISVGRINFQLLLLILSGFLIFGREFLVLWVGKEFLEAYAIALIIMFPYTIIIVQSLGESILQSMNKYSFRAKLYFVGAILNILSTIVMVYLWGIIGAAISTALTMFITSGIILNIYYEKKIGLNIKDFWKNIGNILLRVLPVIVSGYFINNHLLALEANFIVLGIKIAVYTIIYVLVLRFFVFNQVEIGYFNSIIKKLKKK